MINVFIVDDHIIFREGLKRVIAETSDIEVAGESGDGREALQAILKSAFDLILLDLALPGMDGLDVLRAIKEKKPGIPVIILSMYAEEQYAIRVLKEGASGYLTKESVPNDLIHAIRKAASGGRYVSDSLGEKLLVTLTGDQDKPPHENLSSREYQVFRMIVKGKSIKEIAHELSLARTTITSYRARILDKMNMKTNADLIRYAIETKLTP
ncbi:MAG: response regulator transcription factor [Deltaproteobacteria bacterium]|nr:response regulator transcription factor [Deltaproteobacteria bacterium]